MKELDTLTVSKVGQSVLPKWWREASGLEKGGIVEVRPIQDGRNSILLTPKPTTRRGLTGKKVLEIMQKCPHPFLAPQRHKLPIK